MGRRFVCWLGVALAMAFLPGQATAGERRFATANPSFGGSEIGGQKAEVGGPKSAVHAAQPVTFATANPSHGGPEVATLTFAKTTAPPSTRGQTAKEPAGNEGPGKRKTITLFRFSNSKVGEVSVQPVVGRVNGAQLSIGF
jgi:hypothetical protein